MEMARLGQPDPSAARGRSAALRRNLTQREIGERVGYSQMHISRQLSRALTVLEGD